MLVCRTLPLIVGLLVQVYSIESGIEMLASFVESIAIQEENVRRKANESDESFFGVLHSQEAYNYWAKKEDEIMDVLEKRLVLIDEEIELIEEYLEDYDESTGEAMRNLREPKETPEERGRVVGSSAVLGHRMTSRYAGVIANIRRFLTSDDYLENEEALAKILDEIQEFVHDEVTNSTKRLAPGSEDLFLTMASYFHVQHIYGFTPSQLLFGLNPNNAENERRMSALQCAELGMFAIFRREYQIAVEWLEVAEQLLWYGIDVEDEFNIQRNIVTLLLRLAIQHHNRAFHNPKLENDLETLLGFYVTPITPHEKRVSKRDALYQQIGEIGPDTSVNAQFMHLCHGKTLQAPAKQKKLKCYLEQKRNPFLYINPVKVEQLSETPLVYQYYEMIGNKTIELLKQRYSSRVKPLKNAGLSREIIPHWSTGGFKAFHPQEIPPEVFDLAEAVSGIKIRGDKEILQYVEYTTGRYSIQQPDSLQASATEEDGLNPHDEWMATILYNLELPEAGGLASFCQAGVSAYPIKGSAILYYNTYHNGTFRADVHHGTCPVLEGRKIVLNRWIRYLDNWESFGCKKNQWE